MELNLQQEVEITFDCYAKQKQAKTTSRHQKSLNTVEVTRQVLEEVPADLQ